MMATVPHRSTGDSRRVQDARHVVREPAAGSADGHFGRREFIRRAGALSGAAALGGLGVQASFEETAQAAAPGGTLNVVVPGEPNSFDWQALTTANTQQPSINIYETLYALSGEYAPVPMLAADHPTVSADGLTATIPLRRGVKFHNGEEMTAEDVVASLERWGKVSGAGRFTSSYFSRVNKSGNYAVDITLAKKFGALAATLAVPIQAPAIMPASVMKAAGTNIIKENSRIIGTGPFKLAQWVHGSYYLLERFPEYSHRNDKYANAGGLAGAKRVYVGAVKATFADRPVRLNGLLTGQFDYANSLPGDYLPQITSHGFRTRIVKTNYNYDLMLNSVNPPTDDPLVRHAIANAINYDTALLAATGSKALYALDGAIYFPSQKPLYTKAGLAGAYDVNAPAKAKALLKEAGYKGRPLMFLQIKKGTQDYIAAQAIIPQLQAVGLNIETRVMDWATLIQIRTKPHEWNMFMDGFGAGYIVPNTQLFLTDQFPFHGWYGPNASIMQGLLRKWIEVPPDQEQEVMAEIQTRFYRDMPMVKLGNTFNVDAYSPKVTIKMGFYHPTWWDVHLSA